MAWLAVSTRGWLDACDSSVTLHAAADATHIRNVCARLDVTHLTVDDVMQAALTLRIGGVVVATVSLRDVPLSRDDRDGFFLCAKLLPPTRVLPLYLTAWAPVTVALRGTDLSTTAALAVDMELCGSADMRVAYETLAALAAADAIVMPHLHDHPPLVDVTLADGATLHFAAGCAVERQEAL